MKSRQEKLNYLASIKKKTEIHTILEELLPEMYFSDVKVTHEKGNKPEFGKDLICSYLDEIENKKDWFAFVVKKEKYQDQLELLKKLKIKSMNALNIRIDH